MSSTSPSSSDTAYYSLRRLITLHLTSIVVQDFSLFSSLLHFLPLSPIQPPAIGPNAHTAYPSISSSFAYLHSSLHSTLTFAGVPLTLRAFELTESHLKTQSARYQTLGNTQYISEITEKRRLQINSPVFQECFTLHQTLQSQLLGQSNIPCEPYESYSLQTLLHEFLVLDSQLTVIPPDVWYWKSAEAYERANIDSVQYQNRRAIGLKALKQVYFQASTRLQENLSHYSIVLERFIIESIYGDLFGLVTIPMPWKECLAIGCLNGLGGELNGPIYSHIRGAVKNSVTNHHIQQIIVDSETIANVAWRCKLRQCHGSNGEIVNVPVSVLRPRKYIAKEILMSIVKSHEKEQAQLQAQGQSQLKAKL